MLEREKPRPIPGAAIRLFAYINNILELLSFYIKEVFIILIQETLDDGVLCLLLAEPEAHEL